MSSAASEPTVSKLTKTKSASQRRKAPARKKTATKASKCGCQPANRMKWRTLLGVRHPAAIRRRTDVAGAGMAAYAAAWSEAPPPATHKGCRCSSAPRRAIAAA